MNRDDQTALQRKHADQIRFLELTYRHGSWSVRSRSRVESWTVIDRLFCRAAPDYGKRCSDCGGGADVFQLKGHLNRVDGQPLVRWRSAKAYCVGCAQWRSIGALMDASKHPPTGSRTVEGWKARLADLANTVSFAMLGI